MLDSLVNGLGSAADPWGYVLLFVLTLLEASAFIGLLVPGETALFVAGVLAGQGRMSLPVCIVVGVLGAIIGDSVGYEIGRFFGPRLRSSKAGAKVGDDRWDRAHGFVRARGPQAVFFGRWVGLLRALVPAIAGDARMPYGRFLLWNMLGALASSPIVILLGYTAGSSYGTVERRLHYVTYAVLAIVAVAVAVRTIAVRRLRTTEDESEVVARPRRDRKSPMHEEDRIFVVMYSVFVVCIVGLVVAALAWG